MKYAIIIVRILLGAMYVFASVVFLFHIPMEQPKMGANAITFMTGVTATGYLMTLVKITELVCGLALIIGRFAPLATVVIFPITLNIFFFHAFMEQSGIGSGLFVLVTNLFLAYAYRKNYVGLVSAKPLA